VAVKAAPKNKITIPLLRPSLPTAAKLGRYLRRIDRTRWYTNFGALQLELEARLAKHFGLKPANVALFANGTLALTHALQAFPRKTGQGCLLPSWTFAATPAATLAANLQPHFADVNATSWALEPDAVLQRRDLQKFSAVVTVSPFGTPLDHQGWDNFTAKTGIPVLIDGAAAFDSIATQKKSRIGATPVMISLHATKCFGLGEGGLLLSRDTEFIARARQWGNFGFVGVPLAHLPGGNGKFNEYGAAIGHAALDAWPVRRRQLLTLTKNYAAKLAKIRDVTMAPGFNSGFVSNSCNVLTRLPATQLADQLAASGIQTRRWWGDGCHAQPAYKHLPRDPLPVTEGLAKHALGLPFFHDLKSQDLRKIIAALTIALRQGQ
jgi:dTDP-4-amino-4,6-dideoxygalactose transaminase